MKSWWIMRGDGQPRDDWELPAPPAWRTFAGRGNGDDRVARRFGDRERGATFQFDDHELDLVNTAMLLRRPLLVTGAPGTGKSSLAFAIAHDLKLGPVLYWPINSRSTLREGLYGYDAIGRLQETSLQQASTTAEAAGDPWPAGRAVQLVDDRAGPPDIGSYITLGALGTALLPADRPRVLLIDEVDKGDIDLPNDLLNIFEEGTYTIPELVRLAERLPTAEVGTADPDGRVVITAGTVRCQAFPVVVLTSNGERDFPPAFLRRCLQLSLRQPDQEKLARIVEAHLGPEVRQQATDLITEFLHRRERNILATDQLLNAVYLLVSGAGQDPGDLEELLGSVFSSLGEVSSG
jgi:MoxR-like ATPase